MRGDVRRLQGRIDQALDNMTLVSGAAAEKFAAEVCDLSEKLKGAEQELTRAEERQVRDADLAAAADEVMALLDQINTISPDAPVEERRKLLEASVVGIDVEFLTEKRGKRRKHTFLGGDMRIPEPLALAASYLPGGRSLVRTAG